MYHHLYSEKIKDIKFMHQKVLYTSDTNVISSTSKSLPNTQSCFTANKREETNMKIIKTKKD
jgi:hypothetical protein